MTDFQKRLQIFVSEFETAGNKVCSSKEVSQLDVDVLMNKLRKMYDFLLSTDFNEMESTNCETKIEEVVYKEEPIARPSELPQTAIEKKQIEIKVTEPIIENTEPTIKEIVVKEPKTAIEQPIVEKEIVIEQTEEPEILVEEPIPAQSVMEKQAEVVEVSSAAPIQQINEEKPAEEQQTETNFEKEPVKSAQTSVLSYLHNNIMKDGEDKPRTINTTLDLFSDKPTSIAERFENRNRSDLRTAIGVSEKFLFINDLFSGNLKEYTDFINKLNDITTWEMSKLAIEEMKQAKRWISSSLAYTTLEDLIHKRFMK